MTGKLNYTTIKNSDEWEEVQFSDVCPRCEEFNWEYESFANKITSQIKMFRFCWNCGYTEEIKKP